MYFLDDSKRIGMGFLTLSLLLVILGIMFLFNRSHIIMGNLSFFIVLCLLIGIKSTLHFFLKKGKLKGSIFFFLGFFVTVILKLTIIGFPLQIYDLFQMFKSFLPFLYDSATKFPIIGRYLRNPQLKKWFMKSQLRVHLCEIYILQFIIQSKCNIIIHQYLYYFIQDQESQFIKQLKYNNDQKRI